VIETNKCRLFFHQQLEQTDSPAKSHSQAFLVHRGHRLDPDTLRSKPLECSQRQPGVASASPERRLETRLPKATAKCDLMVHTTDYKPFINYYNKYEVLEIMNWRTHHCCIGPVHEQTFRVYSPDGSTFLRDMTSRPPS